MKSASKIGSMTSLVAICTTRSRTAGIPQRPLLPVTLGDVAPADRLRAILPRPQQVLSETEHLAPLLRVMASRGFVYGNFRGGPDGSLGIHRRVDRS